MEESDLDNDFDFAEVYPADGGPANGGPTDEGPVDAQVLGETRAQALPERTVKAYLVKYTAYRTFVCDVPSQRYSLMKA